jgi:hypothetical protein
MRTNLCNGRNQSKKTKMKNKIRLIAAFAIAATFFLTGCIVVNVEKTTPGGSCMSTNAAAMCTTNAAMPMK